MRLGVDFRPQNLLSAPNGQYGHLGPKVILGAIHFLFDLGFGGRDQTLTFGTCLLFSFLNNEVGTFVGLLDDLSSLFLGFTQGLGSFLLGQVKITLGAASRVQTFSNLFLAFCHGSRDRRPDILHAKPDKNSEGNRLTKQRQINIHSDLPRAIR